MKICIIGAGAMGAEIATQAAIEGKRVTLGERLTGEDLARPHILCRRTRCIYIPTSTS